MARSLQIRAPELLLLATTWMVMSTGCVISPPIEAEPQAPERPPFLDFMSPENPIVTVSDDTPLTFSVRAFDENPHDSLFFAWIGEESFPLSSTVRREAGDELTDDELFYRFEVIEREIDPCGPDLEGVSRETLWVYVADAPISLNGRTVELTDPDEGFLTNFAWVLDIRPEASRACQE